jgi:hypothetical protein
MTIKDPVNRAASSWDRRDFIAAAAGAAAVAYLPFGSLAGAVPAVGATEREGLLADWTIDDQWGVYPRYDAIPCAPAHREDQRLASAHPADLQFLA